MDIIELIVNGFLSSLQLKHLLLITISIAAGIVIGGLPGLTATLGVSILLPFTFTMDPSTGLIMLGAIWCGAMYGGSISAILLNIPGTPSSIATTFDGYPMAQSGKADKALLVGLVASVFGGIVGVIILMALFAPLAEMSLLFGKPEYFWLAIFGLTTIGAMSTKNVVKGLLGGAIGLLLGTIGMDPIAATPRFTFDYYPLVQGVHIIPALIGIFAFSQILNLSESESRSKVTYKKTPNILSVVFKELWKKSRINLVRSSIIGNLIGILPGAGGAIASLISYNEAKRWDKNPEKFGKGSVEGLVASEAANNAMIGGALIPMMGLGIPGAPVAAVMMGGLLAHGITPGSKLLVESGDIAYTFIASLVVSNLIMLVVGYFMLKGVANVIRIPNHFIVPTIFILAIIGSYAFRNSMVDVYIMFACGLLAYLLSKAGVSPGPIALGLVLGPIAEEALGVSLVLAEAKQSITQVLFLRPISMVLILLSVLSVMSPSILKWLQKRGKLVQGGNK